MHILRAFLSVFSLAWLLGGPAAKLDRKGRQAERQGDDLRAYTLYAEAADLQPRNKTYARHAEDARVRTAQLLAALDMRGSALALDPGSWSLQQAGALPSDEPERRPDPVTEAELQQARQAEPPPVLLPAPGNRTFDLRGDSRAIYEQVARAYDLNVVFDREFTPSPSFRFRLVNVSFHQALHALMTVTGTFVVPLHERVGLVVKDTAQKRTEAEPMMAALIPIPAVMSLEEANEVGRAVQQALEIKRLTVDANRRQVLVRDTVSKVHLAKALYEDLSRARGEVLLDFSIFEVTRSLMLNAGLTLPTALPVTGPGTTRLGSPGSFAALSSVEISNSELDATLTASEARRVSDFQLRATDGLAANMHIGQRYPIVNVLFSPAAITSQIRQSQQNGTYAQPFPAVNFEDLGLVVKVTPRIHDSHEISLSLEAEFRQLTGQGSAGLPIIADEKFTEAVRLREGESSVISGLLQNQIARNAKGIAGLSQIPLLGGLFRSNAYENDRDELILVITPHLTRLPPAEQFPVHVFAAGTDTRVPEPL